MPRKPCRHKSAAAFSVVTHAGIRLWTCSSCGKQASWGPSWGYFGAAGCRKCGAEPAIEWVSCSEECAQKLGQKAEPG